MKISHVYYHPKFRRSFLNLPDDIQAIAETKTILFKTNPFNSALKTHKLHGKLKDHWSFTIKGQYRIVFIFEKTDAILLDIGAHDIYK